MVDKATTEGIATLWTVLDTERTGGIHNKLAAAR